MSLSEPISACDDHSTRLGIHSGGKTDEFCQLWSSWEGGNISKSIENR